MASGRSPRTAAEDYEAKISHEASLIARRMKKEGHPAPLGNPTSGILLVVEQPVGPRVLDALSRSLKAIELPDAYVTWAGTGLLVEEILSTEPAALVAVGPGAAREIDALDYLLVRRPYAEAAEGEWFAWTKGTAGLRLPALAPALEHEEAKRNFWRAFLALRDLTSSPNA